MDSHPAENKHENSKVWRKVLADGENVEYSFSIGKTYIKFTLIMFAIFGGVFFLLGWRGVGIGIFLIAFAYFGFYLKVANVFAFTNKRVLIHRGWLSTHTISIDYDKITEVSIMEPFIDRLLTKSGNIVINTASTLVDPAILQHIETPYEVKKKLDSIRKS